MIFFATTNQDQFLADDTGERRWLPIIVGFIDIEAIKRDLLQLWAEGLHLFKQGGIMWQGAERLSLNEHDNFKLADVNLERIERWLEDNEVSFLTSDEILTGAFPNSSAHARNMLVKKLPHIMTRLGFIKTKCRIGKDKKPRNGYGRLHELF